MEGIYHVVDHRLRDAGVETDPENVVHYKVGTSQVTDDASRNIAIRWLTKQVPGKEQTGRNVASFEEAHDFASGCGRIFANRQRKAEPTWLRMRGRFGEDKDVVQIAQGGMKFGEVVAPRGDKAGKLLELGDSDCGLHVGRLEVVADVTVNVFVIVTLRQIAQLPFKAAAAGVGFSGIAPAVTPPVAKRLGKFLEGRRLGQHASALTHGDVVRGVETGGCEVAESADAAALISGTDGIAAVLDNPEIVFGCEGHDGVEIKRIAQRVRQHDRSGAFGDGGFKLSYVNVVSGNLNVDEDRDEAVLEDGIDGCGESSGYGDDLVPG